MAPVNFDRAHFEALYRERPDPWAFRTSAYERAKYVATVKAMPKAHYRHILELGTSIGELSALLALRADRLTGVETSSIAIAAAQARCAHLPHVRFVQAHLPDGDWESSADAVILSEVLYYLTLPAIGQLAARLQHCAPHADLILVHWTGPTDYPLSGDAAAEGFRTLVPSSRWQGERTAEYRMDVLHRVR
ncbi:SAM-dependent methyltransferase [Luteibacter sp.]|uniref:SAM-dependent methyltransferase n=1 Tax=Luteibacter sp. TaxID=1886636 RepID=UPI003F80E57C